MQQLNETFCDTTKYIFHLISRQIGYQFYTASCSKQQMTTLSTLLQLTKVNYKSGSCQLVFRCEPYSIRSGNTVYIKVITVRNTVAAR